MQTVPLALEHLRRGGIVLLDNPGARAHLVLAVERATSGAVARMGRIGAGGFQLAVIAETRKDRAHNSNLPYSQPLYANPEGLLACEGLAEAAVDLARLSGLTPEALLCAMVAGDQTEIARQHHFPMVSIAALSLYRRRCEADLEVVSEADLPIAHCQRPFRAHAFRSRFDGLEHLALISPGTAVGAPLVRIHSECLTGDAFGSLRCDCGPQLQESLRRLAASPGGILVYMRGHEGRGIGLANKMRAYALQDQGMDTVEANRALGLPDDARNYAQAAQILRALGHDQIRLLSNNPEKAASLKRHGIKVTQVESLIMPPNAFNARYLDTKATKFRHTLPMLPGATN